MVNVSDWSATPANNTAVDGINIAEGCPAANMNGMGRAIMAGVRSLLDSLPNFTTLMPKVGGSFAGQITRAGNGGYLFNADAANAGGKITIQPIGGTLPASPANGDWVAEY